MNNAAFEGHVYPRIMRDPDIRLALDAHIRAAHVDDGAVIRHELGLEEGRRRIDVAVVSGHLIGWEIKSDVDTLVRLAGQAETYNKVFDYVTLVTTDRYRIKAEQVLPAWWGITVAHQPDMDAIELISVRDPSRNVVQDPMAIAQLLWRDEAIQLLRDLGHARGLSGKARWYVWARMVEVFDIEDLARHVRSTIRGRQGWSGGQLQPAGGGSSHMLATP